MTRGIFRRIDLLPKHRGDEVRGAEDFIHHIPECLHLVVIDTDEDRSIFAEELSKQRKAWIHYAQPAVVPVERFTRLANNLPKPLSDHRAVDVVVINPAFIPCVVWR